MLEHGAGLWDPDLSCNFFTSDELRLFEANGEEYLKTHKEEMRIRLHGVDNFLKIYDRKFQRQEGLNDAIEERNALLKRLKELSKEIDKTTKSLKQSTSNRTAIADRLKASMHKRETSGFKIPLRQYLLKNKDKASK